MNEQQHTSLDKDAADYLQENAALFRSRNSGYGDSYKRAGKILNILFKNGVELKTEDDFNRFCIVVHIINKITRYSNMFAAGGHEDSADDLSVYAAMLRELTDATPEET